MKFFCARTKPVQNRSPPSGRIIASQAEIRVFRSNLHPFAPSSPGGRKPRRLQGFRPSSPLKTRMMPTRLGPPKQKVLCARIWTRSPSCYAATTRLADWHGVHPSHGRSARASTAPVERAFRVRVVVDTRSQNTRRRGQHRKDRAADLKDIPGYTECSRGPAGVKAAPGAPLSRSKSLDPGLCASA